MEGRGPKLCDCNNIQPLHVRPPIHTLHNRSGGELTVHNRSPNISKEGMLHVLKLGSTAFTTFVAYKPLRHAMAFLVRCPRGLIPFPLCEFSVLLRHQAVCETFLGTACFAHRYERWRARRLDPWGRMTRGAYTPGGGDHTTHDP